MLRSPSSVARAAAGLSRWLRTDVRDVLAITPTGENPAGATAGPQGPVTAPGLAEGLERWRVRLARLRLVAVGRRQLLVACLLAVVVELVVLAGGGARGSRVLWLAVPLAVAAAGTGATLRRRVATPEVARLLDHDLSLAERVSTAVDFGAAPLPTPPARGAGSRPELTGLGALVVSQAGEAVTASLTAARASFRPARREWLGLLGAAIAAALVVVLPSAGSSQVSVRAAGSRHRATAGAAATRSTTVPGTARRQRAQPPGSTSSPTYRPPPLTLGDSHNVSPAGRKPARSPSPGKSIALPLQAASGGKGKPGRQTGTGAAQSGAARNGELPAAIGGPGRGGKRAAAAGARSAAAAGGGRSGTSSSPRGSLGKAATGLGNAATGARSGRATTSARAGKAGTRNTAGSAGSRSRSAGAPGAFAGRGSPSGGRTAGHARGTTSGTTRPTTPRTTAGTSRLRIQPGYTPSTSTRSNGRQGQGPGISGGSGRARTGTAGGSGAAGSGTFPFIAPSPNSAAAGDKNLLLNYFGPFSGLLSNTW